MSNKSTDKKEQQNYFHTASKGKYVINVGSDFVKEGGCVSTLEGGRVTEGYRRKKKRKVGETAAKSRKLGRVNRRCVMAEGMT